MNSPQNLDHPTLLIVVTGTGAYANDDLKTGLWLSEVTHIYHGAHEHGCATTLASPRGGDTPVDPESLKPLFMDDISRKCWDDPQFRQELQRTQSLNDVQDQQFDCVYLAGGHGSMYDFPDNEVLQSILQRQNERRQIIAAICHGVCGLLNVKLPDGEYFIKNKKLTGYSWFEETLARRKSKVPFNLEAELKQRGALYEKALIPMTSKVVVDGNLITGENPPSSVKMAEVVLQELRSRR